MFQSPWGEVVSQSKKIALVKIGVDDLFQSPWGEVVSQRSKHERWRSFISRFQSPWGEVVSQSKANYLLRSFKKVSIPVRGSGKSKFCSVSEKQFSRQFQSPWGEVVSQSLGVKQIMVTKLIVSIPVRGSGKSKQLFLTGKSRTLYCFNPREGKW